MLERLAKWLVKYLENKNNALSATLKEKLSLREFYISDIRYTEDAIRMHSETLMFKESQLADLAFKVQVVNNEIERMKSRNPNALW